jgi:hypothetical protein
MDNQSHRKCKHLFYSRKYVTSTIYPSKGGNIHVTANVSVELTPEKIHWSSLARACRVREDGSKAYSTLEKIIYSG